MVLALRAPVADPEQAKFHQRLVDKLKYCKEVLVSIRNASTGQNSGEQEALGIPAQLTGGPMPMSTRASLR